MVACAYNPGTWEAAHLHSKEEGRREERKGVLEGRRGRRVGGGMERDKRKRRKKEGKEGVRDERGKGAKKENGVWKGENTVQEASSLLCFRKGCGHSSTV